MNCKWAEGHLSACLDGTLDPAVRDEVVAHVEDCSHCRAILDDFQRYDRLVRDLPRYEPSDALRARIFESAEFATLVRSLDAQGHRADAVRSVPLAHPMAHTTTISGPIAETPWRMGEHDRALGTPPLAPQRASTSGPIELRPTTGDVAAGEPRRTRSGPPPWGRAGLAAAAVLAVALGSALLMRQGLARVTTAGKPTIGNIAGLPTQPLAAGTRVVYERGGALWSAPERGPGLTQRLTPSNVSVGAGWAVSPIRDAAGGVYVGYIDLKTGTLHIIRSDDQQDHAVTGSLAPAGQSGFWNGAEGHAVLGGLVWSPDGTHLAYLSDATGTLTVGEVPASGGAARNLPAITGGASGMVVWSPDGQRIAFAQASGAGQAVVDYNVVSQQWRVLSPQADVANSGAAVASLSWLTSAARPTVTWASANATTGAITGVYIAEVGTSDIQRVQRLTPGGTTYTAASFAAGRGAGLWLLGSSTGLFALDAQTGALTPLAAVPGGIQAIIWAPNGAAAAVVSATGELHVWTSGTSFPLVAVVGTQAEAAWSPGGTVLAFIANGAVNIALLGGAAQTVGGLDGATALAWAPDGQRLAVTTTHGVVVVDASGTNVSRVDTHGAAGGLGWSVVR